MPHPTGPTKVVTFYSYKGGVGRTMALVNTAYVLAREGWRVLMVDFDLEAPGMTHFFARNVRGRPTHVHKDALDLLLEAKRSLAEAERRQEAYEYLRSLAEYVVPISLPDAWVTKSNNSSAYRNGRLALIPATLEPRRMRSSQEGKQPPDYLERLAELDLASLFEPDGPKHRFGDHVRKHFVSARFTAPGDILFALRDPVQAAYDIVLIDSRTGLNELAGFSIGALADALVVCCGLNQQNIEGTHYFMRRTGLFDRQRAKPFLVAVGPVPPWHTADVERRLRILRRALYLRQDPLEPFEEIIDTPDDSNEGSLERAYAFPDMVEIPYQPQAALREIVFVTEFPRDQISQTYSNLARRIRTKLLPGAVEGAEREIEFLHLLRNPTRETWQTFAAHHAGTLPELRLGIGTRRPPLAAFPTAFTLTAMHGSWGGRRKDFTSLPIAAAVAALRLSSPAPFDRAWAILPKVASEARRATASGLVFFQSSTPYQIPTGIEDLLIVSSEGSLRSDREVNELSAYMALRKITSLHPEQLRLEGLDFKKLQERVFSPLSRRSVYRYMFRWTEGPGGSEALSRLARAVDSVVSGTLYGDHDSQRVLDRFFSLPARPKDILSGEIDPRRKLDLEFDLAIYPLGFWPELLAATAVAVWRGPDAIQEVLAWLHLSRFHYGYAWRVLVDWRYFDRVKEHPEFQAFLRQEDEVVNEIETAIDRGEIPL